MIILKHKKGSLHSNQVKEFFNKSYLNSRGAYILFVLTWRLEGFTRLNGKFIFTMGIGHSWLRFVGLQAECLYCFSSWPHSVTFYNSQNEIILLHNSYG